MKNEEIDDLSNKVPESTQAQTNTPQQSVDSPFHQSREQTFLAFLEKRRCLLPVLIIVLLSLATTSFFVYQNYQLKKQIIEIQIPPSLTSIPSPSTTPSTTVESEYEFYSTIKTEFQKIKEKYNSEVLETNKLGIWWVSTDGLNIINDNSSGIELNSFNCETDLNSQSIFKEMAQLIGSKIDEIMTQNGFKMNQRNSSKSIEDDQFIDYVQAYEKGTVKAVFEADPDCAGSAGTSLKETPLHYTFSFGYTNNFDNNYQQQAPYLKDLGINKAIIRVQKKIGNFVYLNVNFRRFGHYTIAKLINGKWNELYSGQGNPSCEIVKKYEIPKEIISDCDPSEPQN